MVRSSLRLRWTSNCNIRKFSTNKYNFGLISAHESTVYASARPGVGKEFESENAIKDELVIEWAKFMKENGIKRILCLLSEDEMKWYQNTLPSTLEKCGFTSGKFTHVIMKSPNALDSIRKAFLEADKVQEPLVVHCSNGGGRAGLASMLRIHDQHGLKPEDCAEVILKYAKKTGVRRKGYAEKLHSLLKL